MEKATTNELQLEDIVGADFETHRPIFCNSYSPNQQTERFIVIDPISNLEVGAGVIECPIETRSKHSRTSAQGLAVWMTGLSSSGKSTLSRAIYERIRIRGHRVELVDGDEVRRYLSRDLGFSKEDRDENVRRIGFLAELLTRSGVIALVSAISPYRQIRQEMREVIPNFIEVFVNAPLNVCEGRDVKGLYRRARAGEISSFTGIDDPYEQPLAPDVECRTDLETVAESADKVIEEIFARLKVQ
jgi:adenylyl-sulfate kinase